jgi:hypothetical protein
MCDLLEYMYILSYPYLTLVAVYRIVKPVTRPTLPSPCVYEVTVGGSGYFNNRKAL